MRWIYQWLFRSLANQLLVTYLAVVTLALFVVSVWALSTIQKESINDLRNSLEVEAVNLALELDNDLQMDAESARKRIQNAVDRHATKLGVSITIVDRDGHVLADSVQVNSTSGENISNQFEINEALGGIVAWYTRAAPTTHTNWLYVAYPVREAGHTTGVIRVGVPLIDIENRLRQDLIVFLEIIFATGVITVFISLWLARFVNRPVREMSDLAKQISLSGDVSVFLPVSRRDEIGELGLSFNQMIGRLREQERLRQEFIANASHELKTPTMAIGSVVEALQAGAVDDPKLRDQFLRSLEKLVDRQASLLQDLLDLSKLDGGLELEWHEEVNVMQVLSDATDQIRPQAEKKRIDLKVELNFDSETSAANIVPGNSSQLMRALSNILTNAVNYTPEGGSVSVVGRLMNQKLDLTIADTGVGIDANDLPHIFERFYRGDKARTRVGGGTGLGLAITHEIIARHHGSINVDSTVGKGTTFTITLPTQPSKNKIGVTA